MTQKLEIHQQLTVSLTVFCATTRGNLIIWQINMIIKCLIVVFVATCKTCKCENIIRKLQIATAKSK